MLPQNSQIQKNLQTNKVLGEDKEKRSANKVLGEDKEKGSAI